MSRVKLNLYMEYQGKQSLNSFRFFCKVYMSGSPELNLYRGERKALREKNVSFYMFLLQRNFGEVQHPICFLFPVSRRSTEECMDQEPHCFRNICHTHTTHDFMTVQGMVRWENKMVSCHHFFLRLECGSFQLLLIQERHVVPNVPLRSQSEGNLRIAKCWAMKMY